MEFESIENELFMAIDRGDMPAVTHYLKQNPDLTQVNNQRDTVLHTYFKSLMNARTPFVIRMNYYESNNATAREVQKLNEAWFHEVNRRRPIFDALLENLPPEMINRRDMQGYTLLLRAVEMNLNYEAKELYMRGADPLIRTFDYHFGVVEMAAYQNNVSLLDFFYREKKAPSVKPVRVAELAEEHRHTFFRHRTPMMAACMHGSLEALRYLYQQEPETLNDQDRNGDTAALLCVRADSCANWARMKNVLMDFETDQGRLNCLNFLLDKGVRVDTVNLEKRTLLDYARAQRLNCLEKVEALYLAQAGHLPQDDHDPEKIHQQSLRSFAAMTKSAETARKRRAKLAAWRRSQRDRAD